MWKQYLVAFLGNLVLAFVIAHFIKVLGYTGSVEAVKLAIWAWLGFSATVTLNSLLWEGRKPALYAINNGYYLLSFAVVALVITLWM